MPDAATLAADTRPQPGRLYRWLVLLFVSLTMFGNYYVYDAISPIADLLVKQLGFTDANIGLLQGIYSLPNIVTVVLGGVLIDRIGVKKSTFLFGVLCFIGALVTVLSPHLWVMAAGRLIFGVGAEALIVSVTTLLAKWFRGKELSFAFGVNLTISRLGSFAALNSPSWAHRAYEDWRGPLLISVAISTLCIVGAVVYWGMENYAERRYELGAAGPIDKVVFKDLFNFGISYWYIVGLCVVFYSGIFPFQTFAVKFFMDVHGTSREVGGFLSSLLTLFAMFATPLFGLLVDKVGNRALFMMFGSALLVPVYLMMGYLQGSGFITLDLPFVEPWVLPKLLLGTMAMMGIAFSLIPAVMWPSVAYIVDEAKLGTAYGLMTMIQNVGLAAFNFVVGWENTVGGASSANPYGYRLGMWTFSILGFLGMLFAFLLRRRETGPQGHGLESITARG